ncbi:MAG: glyoxalase [Hyphomicrobiales bacterium]|nr:MAG: glyoxalase [Hyphomicrobiales bacterium]
MGDRQCLTLGTDHLGLTVQLDKTLAFFVEALGWKQVGEKPTYPATFISDGKSVLTLWQAKADEPISFNRKNNIGLHHLALKIGTEEQLHILFNRIKDWPEVHIEFAPEFSGQGPKVHFMINEPSGNRIEFSYDPR